MKLFALAFFTLSVSAAALADDAAITFGGNPKALAGHKSVRMVRERVVVTINAKGATYDCRFVFHNEGDSCKVRMGFPDRGEGAEETSFDEKRYKAKADHLPPPVFHELTNFRSFVDGREVTTRLVGVDSQPASWHTKTVSFAKGQTRTIQDTFTADFGFGLTENGSLERRQYVMSTGASWKGTIGEAEVIVRFEKGVTSGPLSLFPLRKHVARKGYSGFSYRQWNTLPKGAVMWSGFATPSVRGSELRFYRRNFEPNDRSNIDLYFNFKPLKPLS